MYCVKCGTKVDDDAMFCHKCGHQFNNTNVNAISSSASSAKQRIPLDPIQQMIRVVSAVVIATSVIFIAFT